MKHHQTLRRGLSVLLSLVMCLSLLSTVALAEEPATATETADFTNNASQALELLGGAEKAEWDDETTTLTLKGVNFTTSAPIAVKLPDGATIELADGTTNTITSVCTDATESKSCGIYVDGSLTIRGNGTLIVTSGAADSFSCGIYADRGGVTISGGTVETTGGTGNYSCGIYTLYGDVTISGEATDVTATAVEGGYESSGIHACDNVTISGEATDVTATGGTSDRYSYGIYSDGGYVTISGGIVEATGGTAGSESDGQYVYRQSCGIYASYEAVIIKGGTVTATGGAVKVYDDDDSCSSYGIYADGDVGISGGTVIATGGEVTGEDAESFGIQSYYKMITISGGHVIARTLAEGSDATHMALNAKPKLDKYTGYYWRISTKDSFKCSTDDGEYDYSPGHTYVEFSNGYTYTITLDPNYAGGKSSTVITGTDGKLVSALPDATRSGSYRFDGWYTAASGGDEITTDDEFFADATVYAHWTYTGSSSGGSSSSATYTITVESAKNGAVTSSHKTAAKGADVTLTVTPDKGYTLETLTVTDASGSKVAVTEKSGKYTFTMPASKVTVKAAFAETEEENPFVDVPKGAYYFDAVLWAAENGVTGGVDDTHFAPNAACTRAQAVTFLWRAAGSPAPKSSVNPFTDVAEGSYYYNAVLWAVEQGITKGTSDTTFSPNANCTRAQIVTFLYRYMG